MPMKEWPIYIISLADAHARRAPLEEVFNRMGVTYEIFDAVDGRCGVPDDFSNLIDLSRAENVLGRPLSAPEAGCALSHLFLYRKILEAGFPGAIIFEDDAILSEGDLFREFMDLRIYECYNLVQLSYGAARVWRCGIGERREGRRIRSERLVHNAGRSTAYSISAYGAEYVLEHGTPVRCVSDWPCDLRPIAPRIIVPKLVGTMPQGAGSHLEQERRKQKLVGNGNNGIARARKSQGGRLGERRNPPPPGYLYFHRFFSKTIF